MICFLSKNDYTFKNKACIKYDNIGAKSQKIECTTNRKIYSSIKEASEKLNISATGISKAIIKEKPIKGYIFRKL